MSEPDPHSIPLTRRPGFKQEVVKNYTHRLLAMAAMHLPGHVRSRVDPEDVLQSVYRSFFRRFADGRFSCEDSTDVWQLLAAMTFHKTRTAVRFHQQHRRDARGETRPEDAAADEAAAPGSEDVRNDANSFTPCTRSSLPPLPSYGSPRPDGAFFVWGERSVAWFRRPCCSCCWVVRRGARV